MDCEMPEHEYDPVHMYIRAVKQSLIRSIISMEAQLIYRFSTIVNVGLNTATRKITRRSFIKTSQKNELARYLGKLGCYYIQTSINFDLKCIHMLY